MHVSSAEACDDYLAKSPTLSLCSTAHALLCLACTLLALSDNSEDPYKHLVSTLSTAVLPLMNLTAAHRIACHEPF